MDTQFDLTTKSFAFKNGRWYDARGVDNFRDRVTMELNNLRSENDGLKAKLATYDEQRDALSQSIVVAQGTSTKIREDAQSQAAEMLRQAEQEAQQRAVVLNEEISQLQHQRDTLTQEIAALRRNLLTDLENEVQTLKMGTWSGVGVNGMVQHTQPAYQPEVTPAPEPQAVAAESVPAAPTMADLAQADLTPEQLLAQVQASLQQAQPQTDVASAAPAPQPAVAPVPAPQPVVPESVAQQAAAPAAEPSYQTVVVFPDDED
jgi:cell division septum initiation protein DivIVA